MSRFSNDSVHLEYKRVYNNVISQSTLESVKKFLRTNNNDDDDFILSIFGMTIEYIEWFLNISIIKHTWEIKSASWVSSIELKYSPIQSITSVYYDKENGDEKTIDDYTIENNKIILPSELFATKIKYLYIVYQAGYDDFSAIPFPILEYIYRYIFILYNHRGDQDKITKIKKELHDFRNFLITL